MMNKKKVIILGAGGNADVIMSTIIDLNKEDDQIEILGFLDDRVKKKKNNQILGKILKKNVDNYIKYKDVYFIWSLRSVNLGENILKKYKSLKIENKKLLSIAHPTSVISKYSKIGFGVTIHPFVNIGPNVIIKNNVHIFAQSLVGHNSSLGNFSYIANNSSVGAYVKVNDGGYLGMNCTIRERIKIGKWSIIGMGSVVIKDIKNYSIVAGNPAAELKKR